MNKTVTVKISDALIRRYEGDVEVNTLRDVRHPELRFRFKADCRGSWFLVLHQFGKSTWRKLGNWPAVNAKNVLSLLPGAIAHYSVTPSTQLVFAEWSCVGDLLGWYEQRVLANRQLSLKRKRSIKSVLKVHLQPRLGDVLIVDLSHALLDEKLVWPLQENYELSTVRLILSVLSKACKQARTLNLITFNPLADVKFSDFTDAKILPKGGAFKLNGLPKLIEQLQTAGELERVFVLMLLLHGTRIGETRLARWSDFDFVNKTWCIPAMNTKTKSEHVLPLSDVVVNLLVRFKPVVSPEFVFSFGGGVVLSEVGANGLIQRLSCRDWCAHDLRKFARSSWMDLGVDYLVGEMLLNHAMSKMDKTYIHTHAENLMRRALVMYHDWLIDQGVKMLFRQHQDGWVSCTQ